MFIRQKNYFFHGVTLMHRVFAIVVQQKCFILDIRYNKIHVNNERRTRLWCCHGGGFCTNLHNSMQFVTQTLNNIIICILGINYTYNFFT